MKKLIKYPLGEKEKARLRERFEEVLAKTNGAQAIILLDDGKITDYYQNVSGYHMMKTIYDSAKEYSKIAPELIHNI